MKSANGIDQTYDAVVASYQRCEDAGGFFDTFYDVFFAKSPEIAPKFANADMEKQKQIVMASVLMMLRLRTKDPVAHRTVEEIGETHSRQGHDIRPDLYPIWLDALCETLAARDPQFSPELETQWREVMKEGIELIVSKY